MLGSNISVLNIRLVGHFKTVFAHQEGNEDAAQILNLVILTFVSSNMNLSSVLLTNVCMGNVCFLGGSCDMLDDHYQAGNSEELINMFLNNTVKV